MKRAVTRMCGERTCDRKLRRKLVILLLLLSLLKACRNQKLVTRRSVRELPRSAQKGGSKKLGKQTHGYSADVRCLVIFPKHPLSISEVSYRLLLLFR